MVEMGSMLECGQSGRGAEWTCSLCWLFQYLSAAGPVLTIRRLLLLVK